MIDKALMRLSGFKQMLGLLVVLDTLQAIFVVSQAMTLSIALTNLWNGHALFRQLGWLAAFFISFMLRQAVTYITDYQLDNFASRHAQALRRKLLAKLFRLGPVVLAKTGIGSNVTLALDGIAQVKDYLHLILSKMAILSVEPWVILLVIAYYDWISVVILLVMYPLVILFMVILGYAAQAKADRQFATYQMLSNHFLDSLRGLSTLKYLGMAKRYANSVFKSSENFRKATMSTLKIAMLSTFALDFFTTLTIAIVAVFLGLRLLNGTIGLLPALITLVLAPDYFLPLRNFASDYHATLDGKNSMAQVQSVLDQPEIPETTTELPQWDAHQTLQLQHVNFAYGANTAGLHDISVRLSGTMKVGIVGMSGSGKSTLINLLTGFLQPASGTITVGDQTVTNLNAASWRKQISYIPQKPYIFADTLWNNLTFYTPDATHEQVVQALKVVGLTDFVASLPDGLATKIGSGQRAVSGGQAQRIALARAFLDDRRKILVFDEPTAHLDLATEIELKEAMQPLMQGRLVLFATHRLHWLQQLDYVLVLDHGRLVEHGPVQTLLDRHGHLWRLAQKMRGDDVDETLKD